MLCKKQYLPVWYLKFTENLFISILDCDLNCPNAEDYVDDQCHPGLYGLIKSMYTWMHCNANVSIYNTLWYECYSGLYGLISSVYIIHSKKSRG